MCGFPRSLAICEGFAYGQEFRATLTGRVLDQGGSPVSNAKLRIINSATGESRDVTTDSRGDYVARF